MNLINAVLIDDEIKSVELLKNLLQNYCPQVSVIGTAHAMETGLTLINKLKPDLLFLDISLPEGDGFQILESLKNINLEVIFTTAHNNYALKAFEFSAIHYLLKPINISKLIEAVNRFEERKSKHLKTQTEILQKSINGVADKIALAHKQGYDFVKLEDIIRIEGDDGYSHFHLKNGMNLLVSKAIGEYEKLLEPHGFFRAHKKHLINLNSIVSFHKGKNATILLEKSHEVTLSYRRREEFLFRLKDNVAF